MKSRERPGDPGPTVSVLIPLHNKRCTIGATVRSALDQSLADIEVLVIDDGSTDGSSQELDDVRDERLRVRRRENRGANLTRNELLAWSSGRYVQFLDADDLLAPTKLERQSQQLDDAPHAAASICAVRELTPDGSVEVLLPPDPDHLVQDLAHRGAITVGVLHRREPLMASGGFDPRRTAAQEYELHLRLALRSHWDTVVTTSEALGSWNRVDGNAITADHGRVYRQKAAALVELLELAERSEDVTSLRAALLNAARHLARVPDLAAARSAATIGLVDRMAVEQALPRRHRFMRRSPGALVTAELLESRLRRLSGSLRRPSSLVD